MSFKNTCSAAQGNQVDNVRYGARYRDNDRAIRSYKRRFAAQRLRIWTDDGA